MWLLSSSRGRRAAVLDNPKRFKTFNSKTTKSTNHPSIYQPDLVAIEKREREM